MDEERSVVIHTGTETTQVGFSGDNIPHSVFPSVVGKNRSYSGFIYPGMGVKEYYIGDEACAKRGILCMYNPIENGIITNFDQMEKVWKHIFYNELRVSPEEHCVLLTESPINSKSNRDKTMQIMFENFETPAIYIATSSLLSLYASGTSTGLILDSGHSITHAIPIYEGEILPNTITTTNIGGRDLNDYLEKILKTKDSYFGFQNGVLKDIKEKYGKISIDYDKEMLNNDDINTTTLYELPDGRQITIGINEKYTFTESLFQPSLMSSELKGIHETTYESIMKCEFDKRSVFFNNIILAGGNTMFDGFANRLTKELESLAPSNFKIKVIESPNRKYSSWIGGSILSSLTSFQNIWISKQEYEENGARITTTSRLF